MQRTELLRGQAVIEGFFREQLERRVDDPDQ